MCFLCHAFEFITCGASHCFRTPICAHVGKDLCTVGQKFHKQHTQAIEHIVFGSQDVRFASAVPVERAVEQCFGKVAVRIEVGPLALTLETGCYGVVSHHLFFATCRQVLVAVHKVLDDDHHLHHKFPVLILLFATLLQEFRILVPSFLAVFLGPCKCLFVFGLVVDFLGHAADNFHFVYRFHTHTQVFFDKGRVDNRATDTHTNRTDLQPALAAHRGCCHCCSTKAKQFLFHIFGNLFLVGFLHITAIDAKCRTTLLCMGGKHRCQIHCSRTLCAVKAPYTLYGQWVKVHGFRTIAPAWCYCQSDIYAFFLKLIGACCTFPYTTNCGVGYHHFHRFAI